jgi:hypothetical protein
MTPTMIPKEIAALDPLEILLKYMNDETLSPMAHVRIAAKAAPYFHPKIKPIPASAAPGHFGPSAPDDQAPANDSSVGSAESLERYKLEFARLRAEISGLTSASKPGRPRS